VIDMIYNKEHHNLLSVQHKIWQKNQRIWCDWNM